MSDPTRYLLVLLALLSVGASGREPVARPPSAHITASQQLRCDMLRLVPASPPTAPATLTLAIPIATAPPPTAGNVVRHRSRGPPQG